MYIDYMAEIKARTDEELENLMERAFTRMFASEDADGQNRFINISRVPLICQSIVGINTRLENIENNITWGVKLVIGAVILGILALIWKV